MEAIKSELVKRAEEALKGALAYRAIERKRGFLRAWIEFIIYCGLLEEWFEYDFERQHIKQAEDIRLADEYYYSIKI